MEEDHLSVRGPDPQDSSETTPLPVVRSAIGGCLMGMANLVPGVSGGTMIVVMGLYEEFISSLADVTRLKFTRRNSKPTVAPPLGSAGRAGTSSTQPTSNIFQAPTARRAASYVASPDPRRVRYR